MFLRDTAMPYADKEKARECARKNYLKNRESRITAARKIHAEKMLDPAYATMISEKRRARHIERRDEPEYIELKRKHAVKTRLKITYGITEEDYWEMFNSQGGKCAICERTPVSGVNNSKRVLVIDHCHDTNKVRGLLCNQCNIMLGMAQNSVSTLKRAIQFLDQAALE